MLQSKKPPLLLVCFVPHITVRKTKPYEFYPYDCLHYCFLCCHWRMPHSLSAHVNHCCLGCHSHWIHCCVQAVNNNNIYIYTHTHRYLSTPALNKTQIATSNPIGGKQRIYFRFGFARCEDSTAA